MNSLAYIVFETNFGHCGIAWKKSQIPGETNAVAYFQLPEATSELTEVKLVQLGAGPVDQVPQDIAEIIYKIVSHFSGDLQDFGDIALDLGASGEFARQVYSTVQKIPAGQTRTYGEVAKAIQRPSAARAVGHALGRNPLALLIPCHRVLAANGLLCGFSAYGGVNMKLRMLELEGVKLNLPVGRKQGARSENIAPLA